MSERMQLFRASDSVSLRRQSDLLSVSRSSLYYQPVGENEENLELMNRMDRLYLDDPTLGVLGMQDELREEGLHYNVKRIRRLLRKMGVEAIYPKRNHSKLGLARYIHPYLLRNLQIDRPKQVWAIDITYIPMHRGFMYLTAIIDVYSRYIVGWQVSNSLEKETQTTLLQAAIEEHGTPEIINSDQGSQYTCAHWIDAVKRQGIKVSMDGKGRATDNVFIERFFRTIKQKHIYLYPAEDGISLYRGIKGFIERYNHRRRHQGINRMKPSDLYQKVA